MIIWQGPEKGRGGGWGGRFKVSVDDEAPLPRGIASATRGIHATLNGGLMMDTRPLCVLWEQTTVQLLPSQSIQFSFTSIAWVTSAWEFALCFFKSWPDFWEMYAGFQGDDHLPFPPASFRSEFQPLLHLHLDHIPQPLPIPLSFSAMRTTCQFHFFHFLIFSTLFSPFPQQH